MKVALFGGAFDPPHIGHTLVADQLVATQTVDEVWFVPVFTHPWAASLGKFHLTAYETRLEMVRAILGDHQNVAEFRQVSYTYPTLEFFSQKNPEITFSWVMGSEYVAKFQTFLELHPGLSEYQFYIYPRAGFLVHPQALYPNMELCHHVPEIVLSSTIVREAVKEEWPRNKVAELVKPAVLAIIEREGLYRLPQLSQPKSN